MGMWFYKQNLCKLLTFSFYAFTPTYWEIAKCVCSIGLTKIVCVITQNKDAVCFSLLCLWVSWLASELILNLFFIFSTREWYLGYFASLFCFTLHKSMNFMNVCYLCVFRGPGLVLCLVWYLIFRSVCSFSLFTYIFNTSSCFFWYFHTHREKIPLTLH